MVQGGILLYWFFTSENFLGSLGFTTLPDVGVLAWCVAALVVVSYVWGAASISNVRQHMFKFNSFKFLALLGALVSGIFEELVFRKLLMDYLHEEGFNSVVQILVSGLAIVYIISDRNLAICIIAHTIVTGLIEPGLIKSAVLDKLGYFKERA